MSFGSCCISEDNENIEMEAKSVQIKGNQCGLLFNFELIQTFYHTQQNPQEVSYLFPNDLKICIYDTTFVVGKEIIKPKLEPKEEAEEIYEESVMRGHTAIYGSNIANGLTKFKLGNVPANTYCKVILKIAFTGNVTKQNSFFVKFPLDVYTPSGSKNCLDVLSSDFIFQLQCDKDKIKDVKSNIINDNYDDLQKVFSIKNQVNCKEDEKSIIINFETINPIQSLVLVGQSTNDYDNYAITIFPNLEDKQSDSPKEFIFVIDCSGLMGGTTIKKVSECLEVFIRSLPANSYFNIVRFGSKYEKLFENSIQYNESSFEKALKLVKQLKADLGGTELYQPLQVIFNEQNKMGQKQVFIMTDGEVSDPQPILNLVSQNSNENRCFTIGIGRGCDAGLAESLVRLSGGKCDFLQEGDSISEKVIPQLQSSLFGIIKSVQIHVENNDEFQMSPYPLPTISSKGSFIIYLRSKYKNKNENKFDKNFLITANIF
ncbi:von Willebrand factor A domain-containing protein 5A [Tritrichomonas musculus]|uniref:von Willebrand factor A domain-containing protein 5A n=1 Tax=Tritrichomonas musculus TaxID=1915356 RepID=A0ABR2J293_9EUKA